MDWTTDLIGCVGHNVTVIYKYGSKWCVFVGILAAFDNEFRAIGNDGKSWFDFKSNDVKDMRVRDKAIYIR